jgi:hypothetical protein
MYSRSTISKSEGAVAVHRRDTYKKLTLNVTRLVNLHFALYQKKDYSSDKFPEFSPVWYLNHVAVVKMVVCSLEQLFAPTTLIARDYQLNAKQFAYQQLFVQQQGEFSLSVLKLIGLSEASIDKVRALEPVNLFIPAQFQAFKSSIRNRIYGCFFKLLHTIGFDHCPANERPYISASPAMPSDNAMRYSAAYDSSTISIWLCCQLSSTDRLFKRLAAMMPLEGAVHYHGLIMAKLKQEKTSIDDDNFWGRHFVQFEPFSVKNYLLIRVCLNKLLYPILGGDLSCLIRFNYWL